MAILDHATFTLDEWDEFTLDQWATFVLDPVIVGPAFKVTAVDAYDLVTKALRGLSVASDSFGHVPAHSAAPSVWEAAARAYPFVEDNQ